MTILRHSKVAVTMDIYTQVSSASTKEVLKRLGNEFGEGSPDPVAILFWSTGMKEAPSDERKGPLTWVETRGIEPRTSCLQSRRSTN
jgi:hypothetical protein